MRIRPACGVLSALAVLAASLASADPRHLSLEDRIRAQEAIERVYYSHRIGASHPFEEAVPRRALVRKVRTYLSQSVALERLWKSPISGGALRRELERIAANTRFPERLREIYEALDRDPYLIQETFVRGVLADRLARGYFAGPAAGGPQHDMDSWWETTRHEFDPALARYVAQDLRRLPEPGRGDESGDTLRLDAAPFDASGVASSCEVQDIWGAGKTDVPPAPRTGHTVVWTGSEMIVWGGSDLNTGARYDPLTDTWRPLPRAGAPAGRTNHTAVWTGSEMIIWGGDFSGGTTLTTGGRYDPVTDAWRETSILDAPSKRSGHTAVWTGREMIIWGGWTGGGTLINTGGRYDPGSDAWSATSVVNAPTLGFDHVAVWTGWEMIVWGGGFTTTGGIYNPATDTWRPTSTLNAPGPRRLAAAVWTGTEMIVWGGSGGGYAPGGGRYNPVTDTWRPTSQSTAPLNRYYHTAVWTGSRMIIWGGIDFSGPAPFETVNTGALYDPVADSWTPTSLAGAPAPRVRHTAIWSGELMIIWGGGVSSGGRYDPSTDSWTPTSTTPSSPSQRRTHTAVWTGSEMIVWGGTRDSSGGRYDPLLDAWTPTSLTNAPSPRAYHAAVWTGREMIVWGGEGSGDLKTDSGGRYDPVSDIWTPTSLIDAPAARAYHTAVWTGREMIVWGGDVGDYLNTNTGGRYDPGSDSWSPISLVRAPSARAYHTAIWSGREMVVWGGYDDRVLNTGGRYDPASDTWSPTSPVNAPSARARQTAVWTGREMIVWGGYGEFLLNTGGRYDPLVDAWTPTPLAEAPLGRSGHSAVWTGREMIVWGGAYQDFFYVYSTNTGGRYDPAANAWAPTTTTNAPEARDLHTAVWIGTAMIVRGGEVNTGDVILLARDPYVAWYGAEAAVPSPDSDQDGFSVCAGDCDDALAAVHPGAAEVCDGLDNDCDAVVDNPPAPAGIPFLTAESSGEATLLSWSAVGMATGYDLVRGDLATLIASGGDFASVTQACLADDLGDTSLTAAEAPATAGGFWYLVRAVNCGGRGSYDSGGPAQVRPRDAGINASASSCP